MSSVMCGRSPYKLTGKRLSGSNDSRPTSRQSIRERATRALARGGGGFHGDGISAGHGGQMDGFSMHGPDMGRHPRGAGERDKYGHCDDRRDRFEHRHDHRYAPRDDQWHRDYGSATGGTTDHIRRELGDEVPASAKATAGRQQPTVSGTLETDSSRFSKAWSDGKVERRYGR